MFREDYEAMSKAGVVKLTLLEKRPGAYLVSAMLAGAYIGIGVLVMSTVGAYAAASPFVKLAMGLVFSAALSLVVFAGAELFTGNNMVGFASFLRGEMKASKLAKLWLVCFTGNWIGSIIVSLIFVGTGLADGDVGAFIANTSAAKMQLAPVPLLCRALLCNLLVCLAVWCTFKCKTEAGKLVMILWCIMTFVCCGFEHCIANMTMLTIGLLNNGAFAVAGVSIGGYFYNILWAAVGNILAGSLMVALPYHIIAGKGE